MSGQKDQPRARGDGHGGEFGQFELFMGMSEKREYRKGQRAQTNNPTACPADLMVGIHSLHYYDKARNEWQPDAIFWGFSYKMFYFMRVKGMGPNRAVRRFLAFGTL